LTTANSQVTSLQAQLTTANAQVTTLEGQLTSANTQVTSLQTELAIMQAKYPAKPFSSKSSLQNWVDLNIELIEEAVDATGNNAIWTAMVAVSNKAQEDGWIINACIDGQYFSLQAWVGNNEVYVISLGTAGLIVQVYP
jgi:hypothetical protein